jgi:pantothenate kinase
VAAMVLAERGNAANVDLLVSDIYGGNCDDLGISCSTAYFLIIHLRFSHD